MNKKTVAHRDIRSDKVWRNFFMLYSASLAALYIALSVSANAEQPSLDTVTSGTISTQIPETRLASYEMH